MTEQENIMEGVKSLIRLRLPTNMGFDLDLVASNTAKDILRFLHSQGVWADENKIVVEKKRKKE